LLPDFFAGVARVVEGIAKSGQWSRKELVKLAESFDAQMLRLEGVKGNGNDRMDHSWRI